MCDAADGDAARCFVPCFDSAFRRSGRPFAWDADVARRSDAARSVGLGADGDASVVYAALRFAADADRAGAGSSQNRTAERNAAGDDHHG